MAMTSISSSDLRKNISDVLDFSGEDIHPVLITQHSKPRAVILSYDTYEKLLSNIIRLSLPGKSSESAAAGVEELPHSEQHITDMEPKEYIGILQDAAKRLETTEEAYIELLLNTASAMETHQSYLYGHNERVAIFSCEVAQQMGCSPEEIDHIRWASLLHDIGEIVIPSYILQKTGNLNKEEWDIIKDHPRVSAEIVGKAYRLKPVTPIIYAHQEKYDGSGYPHGLKGDEIPLGARIISVVESYDAMTNLRLHRDPGNHPKAIQELKTYSGIYYDPKVVEVFLSIF